MEENNPAEPLINGAKGNCSYNSVILQNVSDLNDKREVEFFQRDKETKVNLKLRNIAINKSIPGPSFSLEDESPIKRAKKVKPKIISVVHLRKPNENNVTNKHVPIILKKTSKIKVHIKKGKAVSRSINPAVPAAAENFSGNKIYNNLTNELKKPTNYQQIPQNNIKVFNEVANSDGIKIENWNQVVPCYYNNNTGQEVQNNIVNSNNYFENSPQANIQSSLNNANLQLVNICDNQYYCAPLNQNLVYANNNVNGHIQGQMMELVPTPVWKEVTQVPQVSYSSTGVQQMPPIQTINQYGGPASTIQVYPQSYEQVPKLTNTKKRFVSILKSNQPPNLPENNENRNVFHPPIENPQFNFTSLPLTEMGNGIIEAANSSPKLKENSSYEGSPNIETESEEIEVCLSANRKISTPSETEAASMPEASALGTEEIKTETVARTIEDNPRNVSGGEQLLTVASEDIPYNAEVEIQHNDASFANKVEDPHGLKKQEVEDIEFDLVKDTSERKLFLETADAEFCKAAQRKVKGIPHYGFQGFSAIRKFNHILKLIPDESPATVHALMAVCENQVDRVLQHLRYIQYSREIINNKRKPSSTSSPSDATTTLPADLGTPTGPPKPQEKKKRKLLLAAQAEESETPSCSQPLKRATANTRKKRISYNVDLSDNYADDSDEDYVPGKDLTPKKKKKKRNKRKYVSAKNRMTNETFKFEGCPAQEVPNVEIFNPEIPSTSRNVLADMPLNHSSENGQDDEDEEGGLVFRYENQGDPSHHEKFSALNGRSAYKVEPVGREVLELVKFKKKRTPNSEVVPPVQKYMFAHDGVENFRYMAITKQ